MANVPADEFSPQTMVIFLSVAVQSAVCKPTWLLLMRIATQVRFGLRVGCPGAHRVGLTVPFHKDSVTLFVLFERRRHQ